MVADSESEEDAFAQDRADRLAEEHEHLTQPRRTSSNIALSRIRQSRTRVRNPGVRPSGNTARDGEEARRQRREIERAQRQANRVTRELDRDSDRLVAVIERYDPNGAVLFTEEDLPDIDRPGLDQSTSSMPHTGRVAGREAWADADAAANAGLQAAEFLLNSPESLVRPPRQSPVAGSGPGSVDGSVRSLSSSVVLRSPSQHTSLAPSPSAGPQSRSYLQAVQHNISVYTDGGSPRGGRGRRRGSRGRSALAGRSAIHARGPGGGAAATPSRAPTAGHAPRPVALGRWQEVVGPIGGTSGPASRPPGHPAYGGRLAGAPRALAPADRRAPQREGAGASAQAAPPARAGAPGASGSAPGDAPWGGRAGPPTVARPPQGAEEANSEAELFDLVACLGPSGGLEQRRLTRATRATPEAVFGHPATAAPPRAQWGAQFSRPAPSGGHEAAAATALPAPALFAAGGPAPPPSARAAAQQPEEEVAVWMESPFVTSGPAEEPPGAAAGRPPTRGGHQWPPTDAAARGHATTLEREMSADYQSPFDARGPGVASSRDVLVGGQFFARHPTERDLGADGAGVAGDNWASGTSNAMPPTHGRRTGCTSGSERQSDSQRPLRHTCGARVSEVRGVGGFWRALWDNRAVQYSLWNAERGGSWALGSATAQLGALDAMLGVVEHAVLHAVNEFDNGSSGELSRGSMTVAAHTLHSALHAELHGYRTMCPFCHRGSGYAAAAEAADQRVTPDHTRPPYRLSHSEARLFGASDIESTQRWLSSIPDCREAGSGDAHDARHDTLLGRIAHVGAVVVPRLLAADCEAKVAAYGELLRRLERFFAGDGGPLSVLNFSGPRRDGQVFAVVFECEGCQFHPPTVAVYVLNTLAALMHATRAIVCGALDGFQSAADGTPNSASAAKNGSINGSVAHGGVDAPAVAACKVTERFCGYWLRLAAMATSVCGQIAAWLLSPQRMRACAVRHDADVRIWSHLLCDANSLLIAGSDGPQEQVFQAGLLRHMPDALLGTREAAHGNGHAVAGAPAGAASAADFGIADLHREFASNVHGLIYACLRDQIYALRDALCTLVGEVSYISNPPKLQGADGALDIPYDQVAEWLRHFCSLRRNGATRQVSIHVQNLTWFLDIFSSIIGLQIKNEQMTVKAGAEDVVQLTSYQELAQAIVEMIDNHVVVFAFSMHIFLRFLTAREKRFIYDSTSHQLLEVSGGLPVRHRRGVTPQLLTSLSSLADNAILVLKKLVSSMHLRPEELHVRHELTRGVEMAIAFAFEKYQRLCIVLEGLRSQGCSESSPEDNELLRESARQATAALVQSVGAATQVGAARREEALRAALASDELLDDEMLGLLCPVNRDVQPVQRTLGIVQKHDFQLPGCGRVLEYMAVKWFEVHLRSQKPGPFSNQQHIVALRKEWQALHAIWRRVRAEGVRAEAVNIVHLRGHKSTKLQSTTLHDLVSGLSFFDYHRVRTGTKVGIVLEWLPNQSIEELLVATCSTGVARDWLPGAPLDVGALSIPCVRAQGSEEPHALPRAWQEVGVLCEQVASLIPPEQGTEDHPEWRRFALRNGCIAAEQDTLVSRNGVFRQKVEFPRERGSWLVRLLCLSFKWTLQVLLQLAKGVVLCHQSDVVHGDLEPWNCMFDSYGRVKIIDFGMAIRTGYHRTSLGDERPFLDGNICFLAPECRENGSQPSSTGLEHLRCAGQAAEPPAMSDEALRATDIYTLGCVFWELVTLSRALRGKRTVAEAQLASLREALLDAGDTEGAAVPRTLPQALLNQAALIPPVPAPSFLRPAFFRPGDPQFHKTGDAAAGRVLTVAAVALGRSGI